MLNLIKKITNHHLIIAFLAITAIPVFAERVFLKSGDELEGVITNQTADWIELRGASDVKRIEKRLIRRINYQPGSINESKIEPITEKETSTVASEKTQKAVEKNDRKEGIQKVKVVKEVDKPRYSESQLRGLLQSEETVWGRMHVDSRRADGDEVAEGDLEPLPVPPVDTGPSRLSAFIRSAILPGWGQYYQGRDKAAIGYGSATFLAVAVATAAGSDAVAASTKYKNSAHLAAFSVYFIGDGAGQFNLDPTPSLGIFGGLSAMDFYLGNQRNSASAANISARNSYYALGTLAASIYIANLVDVLLFHPEKSEVDTLTTIVGMTLDGNALITLTFRF